MIPDFTKILLEFKSIPRPKRERTFMEISKYPHYENVCSNILQFYLNPHNEHDLGNLVLNSLVSIVDKNFKFNTDFETIEVIRELKTINDKRLDIVILTNKYAIGVENKIFHFLHNDLEEYASTIKSNYSNKQPINIVLSLNKIISKEDKEKISKSNFINITYEQLFENIKKDIGNYLGNANSKYINYLLDFIKSIENLTSKTMEKKELWKFFTQHSDTIQELSDEFAEYKNSVKQKIYQLKEALTKEEFASMTDKQWIYEGRCLVHDYTIADKYRVSIDTYVDLEGWEIMLFARDPQSTNYLFHTMCQKKNFLPTELTEYERNENGRLIYKKFSLDTEISEVALILADLIKRVENYKQEVKPQEVGYN
jgi:hypothetical protein